MAKALGIDLGTTNSVVAVMEGGSPTAEDLIHDLVEGLLNR
ncbi:MAG TPA: Hsp70 family protein [Syntrophomonadaceae bacterium]|nr:Hsp70 family protein [Syntrophomonadaceae bacterium]HQD90741.1 Hsp70 family protein [Syntrophomonadaceae bacterium]